MKPDGPRRARGRLDVVHVPVVLLVEEQAVKVGADRLIGGGQPGGERGGRLGRHGRRAEQIADGDPLPDQPLDAGALGARVVGVQPLQGVEPRVGRREQAGVERSRGAVTAAAGPGARKAASPVAYAVSMFRASWPVAVEVVSSSLAISFPSLRGGAGSRDADGRHATTTRASPRQSYERTGRGSSKRPHSSLPNPASQS